MKKLLFFGLLTLILFNAQAQKEIYPEENPRFLDRIYGVGYLSLQFGDITYIDVSPNAGYMVTPHFSVGTGITYRYLKFRFSDFDTSIFGWRVFARHNLGRQFLLYGEFENLRNEVVRPDGSLEYDWVPGTLLGAGIQPSGNDRSGFIALVLYNFSHDFNRSVYSSPWIFRVGFVF